MNKWIEWVGGGEVHLEEFRATLVGQEVGGLTGLQGLHDLPLLSTNKNKNKIKQRIVADFP